MSLQLLNKLNGNKDGILLKFLDSYNTKNPRIAWYPSAGEDFRDILYLSEAFFQEYPLLGNIKIEPPDFFIHTDYFPWSNKLFDKKILYADSRTSIMVKHIEKLQSLHLTLDKQIVEFGNGSAETHKVIFTILSIYSTKLGSWEIPLLYVFSENAAFISEVALPNNSIFNNIINVRYGGSGGGGGTSSGIWIKNILKRIGCDILVTDDHYFDGHGDLRIYDLYPQLNSKDEYDLEIIKTIPSKSWSYNGDVHWKMVS